MRRRSARGRQITIAAAITSVKPRLRSEGARNRLSCLGKADGLDSHHPLGHPHGGQLHRQIRPAVSVEREERLDRCRRHHERRHDAEQHQLERRPRRTVVRRCGEVPASQEETAEEGEAQRALDAVDAACEVQHRGGGQGRTQEHPRPSLAAANATAQEHDDEAAQSEQRRCALRHHQRRETEQDDQVTMRWWEHRGDEVEDPERGRSEGEQSTGTLANRDLTQRIRRGRGSVWSKVHALRWRI